MFRETPQTDSKPVNAKVTNHFVKQQIADPAPGAGNQKADAESTPLFIGAKITNKQAEEHLSKSRQADQGSPGDIASAMDLPAVLDIDSYAKFKESMAGNQEQLTMLQNRRRDLIQALEAEEHSVASRGSDKAALYAAGEIGLEDLQKPDDRSHIDAYRSTGEATLQILDDKIAAITEVVSAQQKALRRFATILQRRHLSTLLSALPLDAIREVIVWSKYCGGETDLNRLFEVPWHKDVTTPIVEGVRSKLKL